MVILVRESADGELAMGGFLLDAHDGVKDVVFRPSRAGAGSIYEMVAESGALVAIEPADARKLLHEAVARWPRRPRHPPASRFRGRRGTFRRCAHRRFDRKHPGAGWGADASGLPGRGEVADRVAVGTHPMAAIAHEPGAGPDG